MKLVRVFPRAAAALAVAGVLVSVSACGSSGSSSHAASSNSTQVVGTATDLVRQGLAKQAAGDLAGAEAAYQQALVADPGNKYAHYDLGVIDQQKNLTDKAIAEYQSALKSDPKFAQALFNLAILKTPSDPAAAESLYQQVLAVDANDASAHFNLGLLLTAQGQKAAGEDHIQTALRLDPQLASRLTKK